METGTPGPVRPHVSFSQLSMYLRCSMQYYFRYVLGLKQPPAIPLAVGKGGHAALEANGRHKIRTGNDFDTENLLDLASTEIDREASDLSAAERGTPQFGMSKDGAIASLKVFRLKDAARVIPAAVETEFNLDLNVGIEDRPNHFPIRIVNGRIDLITTDAGIEDYKFSGRMKSQADIDLSPQLTLYGRVFQQLTGALPAKVGLRAFLMGKTPDSRVAYRDPSLMTPEAQDRRFKRLAYQFREVERGIHNGTFIPTDDPITCSWCGFRDRCQSSLVTDFEAQKIRGEA